MRQRKRREETYGLGYYTYWDKSKENGCIYCGDKAETREHIPSKVLLLEPYPDNLPTIPACFKCNNSFSADEEYFACYLEMLKSQVYNDFSCSEHILDILEKKPQLRQLINSQITNIDGKVKLSYDKNRFIHIINKLAICHTGYDFDNVDFDGPVNTWYDFAFNLTHEEKVKFEMPQIMDCLPEISSRFSCNFCIAENTQTGEMFLLNDWMTVQEHRYKYYISHNDNGGIRVKIIVYDYFYCQVDFN